jgi:two-component system chemotaxis sensor kinase CheA
MGAGTDLDDVVKEFLVESREALDRLDRDLVILEEEPSSRDTLASIFRTVHTIKGTSGFLGLGKLEAVAHVGENLLAGMRDGKLTLTAEITSTLLAMGDALRQMLDCVEEAGTDGDGDYTQLVERLSRLSKGEGQPPAAAGATDRSEVAPSASAEGGASADESTPSAVTERTDAGGTGPRAAGESSETRAHSVSDSVVRVDVGLLDRLMNLAGELVLVRNQILQFAAAQEDSTLVATTQRLNLITTELQEGIMKTRMQPIGNVWGKFPRVVRDLAVACGKRVRIETEGEDTEIDKTILEAIKDPLTHMVRNSVDHGIEMPEERAARGKPAEGRLLLRAFHEGGQVNIEITDDGAGIDPERIKQKALQRGLITAEQAARMSDRELLNLIFVPGFSTAETVTNVSGRGVGMDVVRTNIEKIGGMVDVQSRPGQGTTLRVKIPLTLAIIPALIVTSGGDPYAIPQVSLLELVRLEGPQALRGIEMIHGAPVYRLRGRLLPLVYLNRELGVEERAGRESADGVSDAINIVVLQADDRQFGLVVEKINDTEEIVVKPLGQQLKGISTFAGATIMGDGKVALILDVLGIAQRSGVISELRERALSEQTGKGTESAGGRQALLLLGLGDTGRLAIPLSTVARLEEFPREAVEHAGQQEVVQYRGQIMPLVRLASVLNSAGSKAGDGAGAEGSHAMQVVVCTEGGRSVGLVVDRILDIVEETVTIQHKVASRGILGSAVIQNRVTDLLDVQGVVRAVDPTFFAQAAA